MDNYNKYINDMKEIAEMSEYETERAHVKADKLIIEFLKDNNFNELAEAYMEVEKWYC